MIFHPHVLAFLLTLNDLFSISIHNTLLQSSRSTILLVWVSRFIYSNKKPHVLNTNGKENRRKSRLRIDAWLLPSVALPLNLKLCGGKSWIRNNKNVRNKCCQQNNNRFEPNDLRLELKIKAFNKLRFRN